MRIGSWNVNSGFIGVISEYSQVRPRSFTPRPHTPEPRPANDQTEEENRAEETDNEVRHENKHCAAQFSNYFLPPEANCCCLLQNKSSANFKLRGNGFCPGPGCRESFKDAPDKMNDATRNEHLPANPRSLSCPAANHREAH